MNFEGFPSKVLCTPIPDPVINSLLENITDLTELKVVLRGVFLLHQQKSFPPAASVETLLTDGVLIRGLSDGDSSPHRAIATGLQSAVYRNIFKLFNIEISGLERSMFLLNTDASRRWLSGNKDVIILNELPDAVSINESVSPYPKFQKSNIFVLYEENIGTISPMLAEELKLAEQEYNYDWVQGAFQIAVNQNKRNWGYISAILRRWSTEGRDDKREYGKSRGYTQENNPGKYIEEYQRRRGRLPWEQSGDQGDGRI